MSLSSRYMSNSKSLRSKYGLKSMALAALSLLRRLLIAPQVDLSVRHDTDGRVTIGGRRRPMYRATRLPPGVGG